MKSIHTKVAEIQSYFINKITACDFEIVKTDLSVGGWVNFDVEIDGLKFNFSVNPDNNLFYCNSTDSFMRLIIPHDRLENLKKLIKEREKQAKQDKIQSLKEQLQKLTEDNE